MKKIAITQRLVLNDSYYELREALDVEWGALFQELEFLPIILPIEYDFKKYFKMIDIDGILLTGGNDLDSISQNDVSQKRDDFEKKLIDYAIENNIPIFGICRGMQILAEYFGVDLIKVENQIAVKHQLFVNENSKYFNKLININEVNSFHNYAVNQVSKEFIISAWDKDREVIKAIEHKKHKIFGQMWHSEREKPFVQDELNLIRDFFDD